ncbi:hypothetical protein AC1031_005574 [Aphanomyces cochlioides]|nr:hypothetical protein AC1031_005574 [Aphanomyces cochlioides]
MATTDVPSTPVAAYNAVEDTKGDGHADTLIHPSSSKSSVRSDGYKPVFLGQSARDLWLIPLVLFVMWGIVAAFFALLLQAVVKTTPSNAALWMFFGVFFIAVSIAAFFINVTNINAKDSSHTEEA